MAERMDTVVVRATAKGSPKRARALLRAGVRREVFRERQVVFDDVTFDAAAVAEAVPGGRAQTGVAVAESGVQRGGPRVVLGHADGDRVDAPGRDPLFGG